MKKIISVLLVIMFLPLNFSFSQEAMYGDYVIASTQKIISLDLEGAKLVDVLKMLSQQTNLNFISTEAIKDRTLTLYLDKVPLKEALDLIFKANNLTYDYYPEGNLFIVKELGKPAIELRTKVYHLRYVRIPSGRMEKELTTIMEATATAGAENMTASSSGGGGGSSSGATTGGGSTSTTNIGPIDEIGLKNTLKKVVTEFGKVTEDPKTNSIIVTDVPSQFPVIDEVVASLDIPTPKVMIEAEMLDVDKNLVDKIGFKYGSSTAYNGDFTTVYSGPSRQTAFPLEAYRHDNLTASPTFTYGNLALGGINALMQFLAQDTTTKILARPKILTLSNETAEVNITTDEAIGIVSTTVETTTTSQPEREQTGTKLRVTPQVNSGTGEITLFVEVFTREATEGDFSIQGMSGGKVRNPEERAARSIVRLKDGETLLIGGLIKKKEKTTKQKVPFLGDIPFVGGAFRYKDNQNETRELLVFLTPRIISDAPTLSAEKRIAPREQYFSKKESIGLALDKFANY